MAGEDHPFLRPLWRRVALVIFCVAWAIFEIFYGQSFWAMIAIGMAGYGAWIFLIAYKPGPEKEKE